MNLSLFFISWQMHDAPAHVWRIFIALVEDKHWFTLFNRPLDTSAWIQACFSGWQVSRHQWHSGWFTKNRRNATACDFQLIQLLYTISLDAHKDVLKSDPSRYLKRYDIKKIWLPRQLWFDNQHSRTAKSKSRGQIRVKSV